MKMTICFTSKKIIINKGFAEKATVYGSEEYRELLKTVEIWRNLCYNGCNDYNAIFIAIFEVNYGCQL